MMLIRLGLLEFESPWFLMGILLVPLSIYLDHLKEMRRAAIPYNHIPQLLSKENPKIKLFHWIKIARYLVLALFSIVLSRPVIPSQAEEIEAESVEIALVLDVSSSMLAKDFDPNRLEAAKAVAAQFIKDRPHDIFTLVVFAAESLTLVPLTNDKNLLIDRITNIECGHLKDGTALGMGLATAVNRLRKGQAKEKVVILITDGVNNAGYIQPEIALSMAIELGIKVYTVGIGSEGEALTPVARRADGEYIFGYSRVEIDEALLLRMAELSGGKYFRATDKNTLQAIYDEIDQLEKTPIRIATFVQHKEVFRPFLGMAILWMYLELMIRSVWVKRLF